MDQNGGLRTLWAKICQIFSWPWKGKRVLVLNNLTGSQWVSLFAVVPLPAKFETLPVCEMMWRIEVLLFSERFLPFPFPLSILAFRGSAETTQKEFRVQHLKLQTGGAVSASNADWKDEVRWQPCACFDLERFYCQWHGGIYFQMQWQAVWHIPLDTEKWQLPLCLSKFLSTVCWTITHISSPEISACPHK